jgi:hypothetical protein
MGGREQDRQRYRRQRHGTHIIIRILGQVSTVPTENWQGDSQQNHSNHGHRAWRDAGPKLAKLGIKFKLPEPYNGWLNIDNFENWLSLLVLWLKMYNLDRINPHIDLMRVQLLCQMLKGCALGFYQTCLVEVCNAGETMSFRGTILIMKEWFLHQAAALDTAQKFKNVTQVLKTCKHW